MPSPETPLDPADTLRLAGSRMRQRGARFQNEGEQHHADLLMALADEMAEYPAVVVPNGVSIASQPNKPSAVWTAAYRLAVGYLERTEAFDVD